MDTLRLDDQVCFALHAASRAMTAAYQPLLAALEITYPQYLVLLVLWEENAARVSRIGERLFLDSATLTPLLKRLESRGLVERRRSTEDERVVEVHLTAEGKRLKRRCADIPRELCKRMDAPLSQLKTMRTDLQALTRTLHAATARDT